MAIAVVVLLEVVYINESQAHGLARAQAAAVGALQHVVEVAAVGQPCQSVHHGQALQGLALQGQAYLVAHAHLDHGGTYGLGDIVGRAQAQAVFLGLGIALAGDEDDGDMGGALLGAQRTQHLVAVHAGHGQVQQDQLQPVGFALGDHQRTRAVLGQQHTVVGAQQLGQHAAVQPFVVND